jgi:hypothetical protein
MQAVAQVQVVEMVEASSAAPLVMLDQACDTSDLQDFQ